MQEIVASLSLIGVHDDMNAPQLDLQLILLVVVGPTHSGYLMITSTNFTLSYGSSKVCSVHFRDGKIKTLPSISLGIKSRLPLDMSTPRSVLLIDL